LDPLLPKQVRYQAALHADSLYSNRMSAKQIPLTWLKPGESFPPVDSAWGENSGAPGLLAGGGDLSVATLLQAYSAGIFPWFSAGQPILWWSTDPRMVLQVEDFRLHRSFKKTLHRFVADPGCEVRFDSQFGQVIRSCAHAPRAGHPGTWILPEMVSAYEDLHAAGAAHSVETWRNNTLVGGLYCVALGGAVFGESMFTREPDASKIALAALVAFCRENALPMIDCQQNTGHLASMGAAEIPRQVFAQRVRRNLELPAPDWHFKPLYWAHILGT
jgi:leucyl/phenylalanyl-tRNA---protein transferase